MFIAAEDSTGNKRELIMPQHDKLSLLTEHVRLNIQQITIYLQCTVCVMSKYPFC